MKRIIGMAAGIVVAGAALAQTATTTTTTTEITSAQQIAVKSYIEKQKAKVVAAPVPSRLVVTPGAVLPEVVELGSFPNDMGLSGLRYAIVGGKTVLVGTDRRIFQIID
jgi:hypothetical protein